MRFDANKGRGQGNSNSDEPNPGFLSQFFYFGLGVKRWIILVGFGVVGCSVGLGFLVKNIFGDVLPNLLPWHFEGVVLAVSGLGLVIVGVYGLYRSVGPILLASYGVNSLAKIIYTRRFRSNGPRVVVIGGGTGLPVLLRGLKTYTDNLTAIVTVADDGGSSGRLRKEMGVLPPGDFRNCLVALSEDESLVGELFQYRFDQGEGLEGHNFGNLFIAAMSNVTGSFEDALYESSRVLKVRGQILPATVANINLLARLRDGTLLEGESAIGKSVDKIEQLFVEPTDAEAYSPALIAILEAQLIVIGPGSLYTSLLPNLLVAGIGDQLNKSKALKIYICNVATQAGETDAYSVEDHVRVLQTHTFPTVVDLVVANDGVIDSVGNLTSPYVAFDGSGVSNARVVEANLVDEEHPARHDPRKLAKIVIDLYNSGGRSLRKGTVSSQKGNGRSSTNV